MASLQGVLARIPGLAGYAAGQEEDRIAAQAAQQGQMGQLQQVGALQGILAKVNAAKQHEEMKGVLSRVAQQAGGDPAKMGPLLMQTGDPSLMALGQKLMPKAAEPKLVNTVAADGVTPISKFVNPTVGDVYPTAKPADTKGTWSEPYQLNGVTVQKNSADGQIRTAVTREPQIRISNPPAPHYERGVGINGNLWVTPFENGKPGKAYDTGVKPQGLTTSGNQQAMALRRDYNANPEVKLANSLEPKVGPTAEYVASVGGGMGNAVGDAELVKLWLMTTHPKGDQISNLDHRQIQSMPDLWGRVKNVAGNFVFGKTLDADTRADMWRSISQKYKATAAMRDKYKADVIGRGKGMNIDQSLIFAPQQE